MRYKYIKYFSNVISGTVLLVNSTVLAYEEERSSNPIWLSCKKGISNSSVYCEEEEYELITNKELISELQREIDAKSIDEQINSEIEIADSEIKRFFSFLGMENPQYEEPELRLGKFSVEKEKEFKDELRAIYGLLKKKPNMTFDDMYKRPELSLTEINKEHYDKIIRMVRKNNYGTGFETDKNSIAGIGVTILTCGIIGGVIGLKLRDGGGDKPGDPPGQDVIKGNSEDIKRDEAIYRNLEPYYRKNKC